MKPGPKPKGQVEIKWSRNFAYAIGLIVADGCLSSDGRHLNFTSKDKDLIELFKKCLNLKSKISSKVSGSGSNAFYTQFGDVLFYTFLQSIGLSPAKSKTIAEVKIPDEYFVDFFRGYFDGDGSSCSYFDPTFTKSFRLYISFTSASPAYIDWFRSETLRLIGVKGYLSFNKNNAYVQLKYAKKEAVLIAQTMYYDKGIPHLKRKYVRLKKALLQVKKAGVA
jgi:hypothetical protein